MIAFLLSTALSQEICNIQDGFPYSFEWSAEGDSVELVGVPPDIDIEIRWDARIGGERVESSVFFDGAETRPALVVDVGLLALPPSGQSVTGSVQVTARAATAGAQELDVIATSHRAVTVGPTNSHAVSWSDVETSETPAHMPFGLAVVSDGLNPGQTDALVPVDWDARNADPQGE